MAKQLVVWLVNVIKKPEQIFAISFVEMLHHARCPKSHTAFIYIIISFLTWWYSRRWSRGFCLVIVLTTPHHLVQSRASSFTNPFFFI